MSRELHDIVAIILKNGSLLDYLEVGAEENKIIEFFR